MTYFLYEYFLITEMEFIQKAPLSTYKIIVFIALQFTTGIRVADKGKIRG